ncbi:hypothetical protein B0I33_101620 [Prauserella shujinwangii]|uniref:Transcriptional regulator n=1 Tax=Prauserella shujinwangii TaxID=1453103 RepID=A0A2T0M418_9PSEU|nr:hypothetical protein [Prauserella shujinwangii]PRX51466.1 hypothetical protein B0I33_101620 [Prauserella shujinwangii]
MRAPRVANHQLGALLAEAGWNGPALARAVNRLGAENGLTLRYQRASVAQWLTGVRPRPPVPDLVAEALSRALGRTVTAADAGLTSAGPPREGDRWEAWWHQDIVNRLVDAYEASTGTPGAPALTYRTAALSVPPWATLASIPVTTAFAGHEAARAGRVDPHAATAMLRVFSDADLAFGGGHARTALAGYLASTIAPALRSGGSPASRGELLRTAARLTYLCGYMCFDDELHGLAQHYYLAGLRLAVEGADHVVHAMSLRALSLQARLLGHRGEAVDLAEAAARRTAHPMPPRTRACLLGQLGVAQAAAGDRRGALASLRAADGFAARADHSAPPVGTCHQASLAYQHAAVAAYLGSRGEAIRLLTQSVRTRPRNELRTRTITLARLAELQLSHGRLEQACESWHRFLDDYPLLSSGRADTAFATLRGLLRSHSGNVAARNLLRRTRSAVP